MTEEHSSPLNIFIGFAWEDQRAAEILEKSLLRLKLRELVIWHQGKVRPGESRVLAVEKALSEASLILLLISADYFASDNCSRVEMPRALLRWTQEGTPVIPVFLRPVFGLATSLEKIPGLPRNGIPIASWKDEDEAWRQVMEEIEEILLRRRSFSKEDLLGQRLREARFRRGWSQADLAEKMNVNPDTIKRWERGNSRPRTELWERFSTVLGKDADELGMTVLRDSLEAPPLSASFQEEEKSSVIRELPLPYDISHGLSKGAIAYHQGLGKVLLTLREYERALLTYEKALFHEPENTALLLGKGEALLKLERSQDALAVYDQVLLLDPMSSLAYQGRGKAYELVAQQIFEAMKREAQDCFERAKQLGVSQPDTATSLNNLAALYRVQGRYAEAEPLYVRALGIQEQELGGSHPDTAVSLSNLAGLYQSQGRYAEAEPLYVRALGIFEQALGAGHPDTARSLNNLAMLYEAQGKYGEAEPLLERAVAMLEQALGPRHPNTKLVRENYAGVLRALGKEEEAAVLEAEGD